MKVLHVGDTAGVGSNLVHGLRMIGVDAELFRITIGIGQPRIVRLLLPIIKTIEAFRLRMLVEQQKFDIVHVHYATHAYMTLVTGLPYFLHLHGSDVRHDLYCPGLRQLDTLAIRKAIEAFYVTPELAMHLNPIRSDAIFFPNPIDTEQFDPANDDSEMLYDVFCISKLDRFKGIENFLRTIELVWQTRPQTRVVIFNFGNSAQLAQNFLEKYGQDPRLRLSPRIPHNQMVTSMRSARVILGQQCAEYGSLSLSELEAMACCRPVVCDFRYPEAYPEPPPVLASQTPEEACTYILRLLGDADLRYSLGQQARAWVIEYYERQRVARNLLDVYQQYR